MPNPHETYKKSPTSRKLAIHAKCYDCCGTDQDKGWQSKIANCGMTDCALYLFRPYQGRVK